MNWILGAVVYAVFVELALWIRSRETWRMEYARESFAVGMFGLILAALTIWAAR